MVAIALIASLTMTSCTQTPQEKLLSRTDKFVQDKLVPNLKDPKSFDKGSVKLDTITTKRYLTMLMGFNVEQMNHELEMADIWIGTDNVKAKQYNDRVFPLKKTNDSLRAIIKQTPDTSISHINIHYGYRAKNSYGALDVHTAFLIYEPKTDELKLINE